MKGTAHVGDQGADGCNIKIDLRDSMWGCELDSSGSE